MNSDGMRPIAVQVKDSDGNYLSPAYTSIVLTYSGGNLSTLSMLDGADTVKTYTFTYTSNNLTGIAKT